VQATLNNCVTDIHWIAVSHRAGRCKNNDRSKRNNLTEIAE